METLEIKKDAAIAAYENAEYSTESAVYEAESWLNGDSDEDLFE